MSVFEQPELLMNPSTWSEAQVAEGKLYRYVETGIQLPLIEIFRRDIPKLEGYEYFEPDWVVAQEPTLFAIYDRHNELIFSPLGLSRDYSVRKLLLSEGYEDLTEFREKFAHTLNQGKLSDLDIWVRLGLPAKVFIPSLQKKYPL